MNLRLLKPGDIEKIAEIHNKFYKGEFVLPFQRKLLNKYVVENRDEEIIAFGAMELVPEIIVIMNKNKNTRERRIASYKIFNEILNEAATYKFDIIQCSVNDENWEKHLKKIGFKDCRDKLLYKKV